MTENDLFHASSKTRWNLLLRTAQGNIDLLSVVNFDDDEQFGYTSDGRECDGWTNSSLSTLVVQAREIFEDLQEILEQRRRRIKDAREERNKKRGKTVATLDSTSTDSDVRNGSHGRSHQRKPEIPEPALLRQLSAVQEQLRAVENRISRLTSKSSAKEHRLLLEEREAYSRKLRKFKQREEVLASKQHMDFLSVGSAIDLYHVMSRLLTANPLPRSDLLLFLFNFLAHTVILSLFEHRVSLTANGTISAVGKILDLADLATQYNNEELKMLFVSVFDHPALVRTTLPAHLDKATFARYEHRHDPSDGKLTGARAKEKLKAKTGAGELEKLEFWLLSRTWVNDEELMTDSYAVVPKTKEEERVSKLDDDTDDQPSETGILVDERERTAASPVNAGPSEVSSDVSDDEDLQSESGSGSGSGSGNDVRSSDDLELPSAPATQLPVLDRPNRSPSETSIDEIEAQRLIQLFAGTPDDSDTESHSNTDSSGDLREELDSLTPDEQEAMKKALAAAEEHYIQTRRRDMDGEDGKSVDDLLNEAKDTLKQLSGSGSKSEGSDLVVLENEEGPGKQVEATEEESGGRDVKEQK